MNEYGSYTETLRTIGSIYNMAKHFQRSLAARKGWVTRRANQAKAKA